MQIDAILCNYAEAVDNLLYISGGGLVAVDVPPGANPPFQVSIGIGIMVTAPWQQAGRQHQVEISLFSEDGAPVKVPVGPDDAAPLYAQVAFTVGRSPGAIAGDDQHVALAVNLPALPLPAFGKYEFVIRLDGAEQRRLGYRAMPRAGAEMTARPASPSGASSLPV